MSAHTVLYNPRLPDPDLKLIEHEEAVALRSLLPESDPHTFVLTSGTSSESGKGKWVALSQTAIRTSAQAVVEHLGLTSTDRAGLAIPAFHVGGLGLIERARIVGAPVLRYEGQWDPKSFNEFLAREKIGVTSLVPTQLHDLVMLNLSPPKQLRVLVIGGGRLSELLLKQALALGWPVSQSYGLTECCSQVATSPVGNPWELKLLPHVEARVDADHFLWIKSPSLLTGYVVRAQDGWRVQDPKIDGWFKTADLAVISGRSIALMGRAEGFVKIGGESTHLPRLEENLQKVAAQVWSGDLTRTSRVALCAVDDQRLGKHILLVAERGVGPLEEVVTQFNASVLPFERIRDVKEVAEIPRSTLGKPLIAKLTAEIMRAPQ